jgi:hypothetical protein
VPRGWTVKQLSQKDIEEKYRRALRIHGATPVKGYYETFGKKASIELLLREISEVNLWDLLAYIWAADSHLKKSWLFFSSDGLGVDALAFLAKAALLRANPEGGRKPTEVLVNSFCLVYRDLESEVASDIAHLMVEGADTSKGIAAIVRHGAALAALSWESREIDRACLIYEEMCKIGGQEQIDKSAREVLGTDFKSYCAAGLALMTLGDGAPWIDLSDEKNFPRGDALPTIKKFVAGASATVGEIRKGFAGEEKDMYALNPLFRYLLVRRDDGRIIAPCWNVLHKKYTSNIYHTFFTGLGEAFSRLYGEAFQAYIGKVISAGPDGSKAWPEVEYGPKKARVRTTDWFYDEGRDLLLIECKNKRFRQEATKETGGLEELKQDLKRGIAHGVYQAHRTSAIVRARQEEVAFVHRCNRHIPVVVIPEWTPFINDVAVKGVIRSLLEAPVPAGVEEFVTLSVEELESGIVVSRSTGQRLSLLLRKWRDSEEFGQRPFGKYLDETFSDEEAKQPVLKDDFQRISKEIITRFFPGEELESPAS